jgi:hypothetical protein
MDELAIKLCDIQGRLFELSAQERLDSEHFIETFMRSKTAAALDSTYNRMQWAGEEYLLEEVQSECGEDLTKSGKCYDSEKLYWIGYLYRYWHLLTGESSVKIYRQASARTMGQNYLMFHTLDPEMAVEDLKEVYRQKTEKKGQRKIESILGK